MSGRGGKPSGTTARRTRRRIEVHYGPDGPRHIGYSGNLSRTGMMVRAIRVFAPGTELILELKFQTRTLRLRGRVAWARQGSVEWLHTGRVGMGVSFIDPPADLPALWGAE